MRLVRGLAGALAVAVLLAACTGTPDDPAASPAPSESSTPAPAETELPDPGPRPRVGQCHALSFQRALAVVGRTEPVSCRRRHTAQTYFVGRLDLATAAGHTRRVDSRAAQRQARTTCTSRLPRHLRVSSRELRLRMAQAVWFTPSPARAEAGADWFRCDVVVVAAPRRLLQLPRRTRGWGDAPATAMCATAAPGTRAFERVTCSASHTWQAASSVDIAGRRLPPAGVVADRMESTCRDVARARADDPLDFTWSQESPTKEQWRAGQRYGICWVPA
jgi:Septum formation